MRIEIQGNLSQTYFTTTINKLRKLISIPNNTEYYFLENGGYCETLIATLHHHAKQAFRNVCVTEHNSFSYHHKRRSLIIIHLQEKQHLLKNQKALLGLLLHETMHITQARNGLNTTLQQAHAATFEKNKQLLYKLKRYPRTKIQTLYNQTTTNSLLLLKDLSANTALIKKGLSNYLLAYYDVEFHHQKHCPAPVFYDKFKKAAQKNLDIINTAFAFEFSLLSVLLPFQRYHTTKAKKIITTIKHCYEINIQDIARKCHELVSVYDHYYDDEDFPKRFLNAIFNKIYLLLV